MTTESPEITIPDQAQRLRELMAHVEPSLVPSTAAKKATVNQAAPAPTPTLRRLAHATAIVSGKGGVGKSNLAVNLACALATRGRRVVLFDADLGMANVDVLCGISPRSTIEDLLRGTATLKDILVPGPGGFRIVPGASGVASMANLDGVQRRALLSQLVALDRVAEHLIIDMGAGIGPNVTSFARAAHRVLVVSTPEPTAMTDAYGAIKTLVARGMGSRLQLVVNMSHSADEAASVHRRIAGVSRQFLGIELSLAGVVPFDSALVEAVKRRTPLLVAYPSSSAARSFLTIARRLDGERAAMPAAAKRAESARSGEEFRPTGFFQRIAQAVLSPVRKKN